MSPQRVSRRRMICQSAGLAGLALSASELCLAAEAISGRAKIKIGVVDWEIGKPGDPEVIRTAAKLGFDGLQVDLADVESFKAQEKRKRFELLSSQEHVPVASLALGKLSDGCYAEDDKGQQLVEQAIEVAALMQQRVLLLAFFGKNDFQHNPTDKLVARLKENAPKAEKAGVVLGLEGDMSAGDYLRLVDRVGSPAVKVYFDCVHAHQKGADIYKEITMLGDRICEFHAKDYGHIFLGKGDLDWTQVAKAMHAIGYAGWIHMEQWGEIKGDKPLGLEETHRKNLEFLRKVFGGA